MFQNDHQASRAIRLLLAAVRLERLWRDERDNFGPTDEAVQLWEDDGGSLSSGERVMFLAAFALWNSDRKLCFAELFRLDSDNLQRVATLLLAVNAGSTWIERWIALHGELDELDAGELP